MPVVGRGRGKFVLGQSKIFGSSTSAGSTAASSSRPVSHEPSCNTDVWGTSTSNSNNDQFADPDKEVEVTFKVYSSNVARIIGKRGATIISIKEESSAEIDVDKEGDGETNGVTLKGTQRNVDQAKRLIDDICRKFNGICTDDSIQQSTCSGDDGPQTEEDVWIPEDKCGRVIGSRGSKIQEIQDSSGANVKVHGRETAEDGKVKVTITGNQRQIENAKNQILNLTKERGAPAFVMPDNAETKDIPVRTSRLGRLIGKGGSKLREIQETFSVSIDIQKNNTDGEDTIVVLAGSPNSITKAHEHIDDLVERESDLNADSFAGNNDDENWDTPSSNNNNNNASSWDKNNSNDTWNASNSNTNETAGGWDTNPPVGGWNSDSNSGWNANDTSNGNWGPSTDAW